jgi:hypothetical protein
MGDYFRHKKKYRVIKDEEEYTKGKSLASSYWHSLPKSKTESYEISFDRHCHVKKSWSIISIASTQLSELELKFIELSEKWKDDTGLFSTSTKKVVNDTYLDIIGLGKEVVPFILRDLKNGGSANWHAALKALTKENPVSDSDLNKNRKIRDAWVKWGESKKII